MTAALATLAMAAVGAACVMARAKALRKPVSEYLVDCSYAAAYWWLALARAFDAALVGHRAARDTMRRKHGTFYSLPDDDPMFGETPDRKS